LESSDEGFQIFLEHYDLMSFEIGFPMLLAFHDIEENIPISIFFDVEKVGSLFRL